VHVIGSDVEAKFQLNCPSGPVEIDENFGFSRRQVKQILVELTAVLGLLSRNGEEFMDFDEQFERANQRARELQSEVPKAVSARFDRRIGRIVVSLSSGLEVNFPHENAEGLQHATPAELAQIEITPSGYGLHFPKLDADLYLPALLRGFYGSRKWMAASLGQRGGLSRSRAKVAASRGNGKLGGRPRLRPARKAK
jgi:hypothetical protein